MEKQFVISLPEGTVRQLEEYVAENPGTHCEGFIEAFVADQLDIKRLKKQNTQ
jgi:hypothetical protein